MIDNDLGDERNLEMERVTLPKDHFFAQMEILRLALTVSCILIVV